MTDWRLKLPKRIIIGCTSKTSPALTSSSIRILQATKRWPKRQSSLLIIQNPEHRPTWRLTLYKSKKSESQTAQSPGSLSMKVKKRFMSRLTKNLSKNWSMQSKKSLKPRTWLQAFWIYSSSESVSWRTIVTRQGLPWESVSSTNDPFE